jgi:hypothetical protein
MKRWETGEDAGAQQKGTHGYWDVVGGVRLLTRCKFTRVSWSSEYSPTNDGQDSFLPAPNSGASLSSEYSPTNDGQDSFLPAPNSGASWSSEYSPTKDGQDSFLPAPNSGASCGFEYSPTKRRWIFLPSFLPSFVRSFTRPEGWVI